MLRENFEAAGIHFRNGAGGDSDFHSLSHTFISNLAAGGVYPKVAQALAGYSVITLTMDRYIHACHGERSEALGTLPDQSESEQQARDGYRQCA